MSATDRRRKRRELEREIKKVALALKLNNPTTTREGMVQYRRIERETQKLAKKNGSLMSWKKVKDAIFEFLNS